MKYILITIVLSAYVIPLPAYAGCSKEDHFLGAPSGKKMMSSFDVTFFPTFAFSSTSGTSGCRNWDLVQREKEQTQWLMSQWSQLLEEIARGQQSHVVVFSNLLGCASQAENIRLSLLQNYNTWSQVQSPNNFQESKPLLKRIHLSLSQNPTIKQACFSGDF